MLHNVGKFAVDTATRHDSAVYRGPPPPSFHAHLGGRITRVDAKFAAELLATMPQRHQDRVDQLAHGWCVCPACGAPAGLACAWALPMQVPSMLCHDSRRARVLPMPFVLSRVCVG